MKANVMRRDDSNAVVFPPPVVSSRVDSALGIPRSACHSGSGAGQRRQWRWAIRLKKSITSYVICSSRSNSQDKQELNVTHYIMPI